ncbi:MAG: hypothetical protein M3299_12090 [Thermoproteota archaeon]|nr:hypothetical protein [Thermoproteota archaeon]
MRRPAPTFYFIFFNDSIFEWLQEEEEEEEEQQKKRHHHRPTNSATSSPFSLAS